MSQRTVEEEYRESIAARIAQRGLTTQEVALIVGCTRRTVQRVVKGQTRSMETLRQFMSALRIKSDSASREASHNGAEQRTTAQNSATQRSPDRGRPVVGWRQAARVLEVSKDTLWRDRHRFGSTLERPWWSTAAACRKWYRRLISGPRLHDEPTPAFVDEVTDVGLLADGVAVVGGQG